MNNGLLFAIAYHITIEIIEIEIFDGVCTAFANADNRSRHEFMVTVKRKILGKLN